MAIPDQIVRNLPAAYVQVLEAIQRGDSDSVIAERVDVEPSAIPSLVRLATAKLLEQVAMDSGT